VAGILTISQRATPPNAPIAGAVSLYSNGDNLAVINDQGQVTNVLTNPATLYWDADLVANGQSIQVMTHNAINNLQLSNGVAYGGIEAYVSYNAGNGSITLLAGTYQLELFIRTATGFGSSNTNNSWYDLYNSTDNAYMWNNSLASYKTLNVAHRTDTYASNSHWNRPVLLVATATAVLYARGYYYSSQSPAPVNYVLKEGSFVRIRKL
jgi:hypothetical protein